MLLSDRQVHLGTAETWGRRLLDELAAVERELWVAVAVTLLVDVWLTHLGLQHGLREGNPLARLAIESFGIAALVALKLGVLCLGGVVRELVSERQQPVVPLGLALPWAGAALVNAALILGG